MANMNDYEKKIAYQKAQKLEAQAIRIAELMHDYEEDKAIEKYKRLRDTIKDLDLLFDYED